MRKRIALPGRWVAAAADGDLVWCAAGGRLLIFESGGRLLRDAAAVPDILSLGASGPTVAAAIDPGTLVWLEGRSGEVLARRNVSGTPILVSGGAVWAVDRVSGRAWRLADPGVLIGPTPVPDVDRAAADRDRLWWTSRGDTMLREADRAIDLGVTSNERAGIVACAGSVWVSVARTLIRVGAWAAARGADVPVPVDATALLACADGIVVGYSATEGLFVLDPSVDAEARILDTDVGRDAAFLVATRTTAWVFPEGGSEARLVTVRAG